MWFIATSVADASNVIEIFDAARHAQAAGTRFAVLREGAPPERLAAIVQGTSLLPEPVGTAEPNERRSKLPLTKTVRRKRTTVYACSVAPNFLTCNSESDRSSIQRFLNPVSLRFERGCWALAPLGAASPSDWASEPRSSLERGGPVRRLRSAQRSLAIFR